MCNIVHTYYLLSLFQVEIVYSIYVMISQRGHSVEPELFAMASTSTSGGGGGTAAASRTAPQYISRRQMRARSAGPASNRASRYEVVVPGESSTLPRTDERALINQHVNPYQEFPSLKRGFTLEGMPIMEKDENNPEDGGDACAYYFWAIAIFFFTLALLNLIVLLVIIHVLEITPAGMEAIEFLPTRGSVKFLKDLVVPALTVGSGFISGFAGEPLNLEAENGDVVFQVKHGSLGGQPQLRISPQEINLINVDSFRILDPESGQVYFDAFAPEFHMEDPIESLAASEIETNRLVSPLNKDLFIKSDSGLDLMGAEGISVEAKSLDIEAGQDITLTSSSGSISLDGQVTLDPLALPIGGGGYPGETTQFKLCICGSSGKVFTVPVKSKIKDAKSASGLACLQTFNDQPHPCDDTN